jgi:hypothetical protein
MATKTKTPSKMIEVAYINARRKQCRHVLALEKIEAWWAKQEEKGCEWLASTEAYPFPAPGQQKGAMAPY